MNATEDVCASGYRFYRAGTHERDAINEMLVYYGYIIGGVEPGISERTFKHYAELDEYGEPTYIPLNRWEYVIRPTREKP